MAQQTLKLMPAQAPTPPRPVIDAGWTQSTYFRLADISRSRKTKSNPPPKRNASHLPKWSAAARKIFQIQPSSAAPERVFSSLNNSFGDQQENALQDYVESSLMLRPGVIMPGKRKGIIWE